MIFLKDSQTEINAVIFDLGNVLFDYNPRKMMGELGIAPQFHDRLLKVLSNAPYWVEQDLGTLDNDGIIDIATRKEPRLRNEIKHYIHNWPSVFYPIEKNVRAIYQTKESGGRTFVLSNMSRFVYDEIKRKCAFFQDFDGIILSYEHGIIKPDPAIYRLIIDSCQLTPEKSVFFDDIAKNAEGASAMGIHGVEFPIGASVADYLVFDPEANNEK